MTEATLSKNIAELIRKRNGWARKSHGGIYMAGWPDVIAVYRRHALFLEVKLPGKEGTLTKLQAATLAEAKKAGAIAMMVTSTAQVKAVLDKIDRVYGH